MNPLALSAAISKCRIRVIAQSANANKPRFPKCGSSGSGMRLSVASGKKQEGNAHGK